MNKALSTLSLFKVAAGLALALQFSTAVAAVAPITVQGNKVLFGGQPGSVSGAARNIITRKQ
jgi:hypothetical protein